MAIRRAVTPAPSLGVARLVLAAVLTAGSFTAMYDRYHGSCMYPDYDLTAFFVISGLFVAGIVWLIAEVAHLLHPSWPFAIAVGLVTYAAIGAGVWMADPNAAVEDSPGAEFRPVMSASWSAGLLLEADAFSDYSCGY